MSVHLQREMDKLKKALLSLCGLAEEQVQMAVRALLDRNEELARQVENRDTQIDQREVEVEEDCLKILALHQPVAGDLRFLIAALKMNNDLERIGDLAVNIARKAEAFAAYPAMAIPFDLAGMSEQVQAMLRDSLDAMVHLDARLAQSVCSRDDGIDAIKHEIRRKVHEMIRKDPSRVAELLTLMAASRNLERIADHATNIAEDVLYMIEGRIARHRREPARET